MIGGAKQSDFDDFIRALFDINFGPALEGSGNIIKRYIIDNAPCHGGLRIGYQVKFQQTQSWSDFNPIAAS